jgi:hypothetical protein
VLIGFRVLRLSPIWDTSVPLVLAPRSEALQRWREEGWEEVPPGEALRELDWAQSCRSQLRLFVAHSRVSHVDLRDLDDHEVLDLVRTCIRCREMAVLRQGSANGKEISETLEMRRLVAQVERQTRLGLSYGGRQYKLVPGDDLATVPGRDYYEVVGQADAHRVLDGIASGQPLCADALAKAQEKISKDWRPPSSRPEGLVLLRRLVQASPSEDEGRALTPSQIQEMRAPKEIVDPLMSGAEIELDMSDAELPVMAEEEPPPDGSTNAEDSVASPADSTDSADVEAPDGLAKTAEASGSGAGEVNEGDDGGEVTDGGADETNAGTATEEDGKDNGGGSQSEGGGSPEFW